MGYATSQQLARYHELYQNIDVTFTKEVIKATGLLSQQVFIKALGGQWPCVINSSSMSGAKIIAGIKSGIYEKIQHGNSSVSLRFSFNEPDNNEPISFFVSAKVQGVTQYASATELVIISIVYTQRAPDHLIERLGTLLEANINSSKRREERILITPDSMRKLGILQKETIIFIQGVPRRCIIRDICFTGSKVIMVGLAQFLNDKEVVLRIDIDEPRIALGIKGKIVRTEDVEGRKDLVALAINYHENEISMAYKILINNYLGQQRKTPSNDETKDAPTDDKAKTASKKPEVQSAQKVHSAPAEPSDDPIEKLTEI